LLGDIVLVIVLEKFALDLFEDGVHSNGRARLKRDFLKKKFMSRCCLWRSSPTPWLLRVSTNYWKTTSIFDSSLSILLSAFLNYIVDLIVKFSHFFTK